jgi:hypothetical protein
VDFAPPVMHVTHKVRHAKPIQRRDFEFLKSVPTAWRYPPTLGSTADRSILRIAVVTCALVALITLITGLISLRTSGIAFIMITLAFAQRGYYASTQYIAQRGMHAWALRSQYRGPVRRRALSIRCRTQAHPRTRTQRREHLMFGSICS